MNKKFIITKNVKKFIELTAFTIFDGSSPFAVSLTEPALLMKLR